MLVLTAFRCIRTTSSLFWSARAVFELVLQRLRQKGIQTSAAVQLEWGRPMACGMFSDTSTQALSLGTAKEPKARERRVSRAFLQPRRERPSSPEQQSPPPGLELRVLAAASSML